MQYSSNDEQGTNNTLKSSPNIASFNTWKFLSIGLLAIVAVGFSFPQAFAHITNNAQHMLQHIYNFVDGIDAKTDNLPIDPASNTVVNTRASQGSVDNLQTDISAIKASTDNLPSDPADQSVLEAKLAGIQSDTDDLQTELAGLSTGGANPKSLAVNLFLDVPDSQVRAFNLLPNDPGKTYSGHISGVFFMDNLQLGQIRCKVGASTGVTDFNLVEAEDFVRVELDHNFTCLNLYVFVRDKPGESNTDNNLLLAAVQYTETEDMTEITN